MHQSNLAIVEGVRLVCRRILPIYLATLMLLSTLGAFIYVAFENSGMTYIAAAVYEIGNSWLYLMYYILRTIVIPLVLLPLSFYVLEIITTSTSGTVSYIVCFKQSIKRLRGRKLWFVSGLLPAAFAQYLMTMVFFGLWINPISLLQSIPNMVPVFTLTAVAVVIIQLCIITWALAAMSLMHYQAVLADEEN